MIRRDFVVRARCADSVTVILLSLNCVTCFKRSLNHIHKRDQRPSCCTSSVFAFLSAMASPMCDVTKLEEGNVLSRVSYMKVISVDSNYITVRNENGMQWTISKGIVADECRAPDHWSREEKVTRTELARMLSEKVRDQAFVVRFTKQASAKRAREQLDKYEEERGADSTDTQRNKRRSAVSKEVIKGEERVLRGHLTEAEPFMGRSTVIDLDEDPKKHPQRLVDHRSIAYLVFDDVKYTAK